MYYYKMYILHIYPIKKKTKQRIAAIRPNRCAFKRILKSSLSGIIMLSIE